MYLDWEKQAQDYFAIDIETDGLDASIVWVMCWENIKTGQKGKCVTYDEIKSFFASTHGSIYVGHNAIKFDCPVLNSLVGTRLTASNVVDTLVLSTLYSPSLPMGHSLSAWGKKLGLYKGEFNDWSKLSDSMIEYCEQDVAICAELFRRLVKVLNKIGFSEKTCYIQHNITAIMSRQQRNGFKFNKQKAKELQFKLRQREQELQDSVREVFPPERVLVASRPMFTKSGAPTTIFSKDQSRFIIVADETSGRYEAFEDQQFNLGSPDQRGKRLVELGWTPLPDEHTPSGKPKPFEKGDLVPSLKEFLKDNPNPEVSLIVEWMSVNGRANMIGNWLENFNDATGCIHGSIFVADTLRFRHQKPNTANIPAVRLGKDNNEPLKGKDGDYTYEARDLWEARDGRVLCGTDAAGLELRMLAHYINSPQFTKQVVEGDPHQFNADLAGVTRPVAKTLLYAIQYGAQAGKVGKILGRSSKEGGLIRQQFLDRLGISGVMNQAIEEQRSGRVWLVDGAGVICPSPHAALNYKLQGGGARVMALGACILDKKIRRAGLDCLKVGDIHDEWQFDCAPQDAEEHMRLSIEAIKEAGEELNLNVPLDGNAKKGLTWAETH